MFWIYTIVGYSAAIGIIGLYSVWLIMRGRRMTRKVPVDKRRFLE